MTDQFDRITPTGSMMAPGGAVAAFAPAPTGRWTTATVVSVAHPSPHAVILRLDVRDRIDHLPGQHYVVRLRAEDGYTAQRSYSVASPPSDPLVELWVERFPEGEVSPFLADVVAPGDELEVRGPIGGWFVWDAAMPAVGVAGGSGAVPLLAMLRHARALGRPDLLQLAVSARTLADLPFPDELADAGALIALTRQDYRDRPAGRLTAAELRPLASCHETTFVCGSASFAEFASRLLVDLGCTSADVRVERFGPTG
ncbi:MAG TPA: FAD-binding oxidoreductase [Nakamurella multipartita]|nr:FAD-binding oxidoreductase [Nakamurella multipartita]